ncbi:hypothetical protein [Psychroflexus planctonicus]|nr:hypothetical protein [Psychroflexus planctonicus]
MKKIILLFAFLGMLLISCSNDDQPNPPTANECDDVAEILEEADFSSIETSNYTIIDAQINDDCLEIRFGASGCDPEPWEVYLYSTDAFYAVFPLQRAVKMELINNQDCAASFEVDISFDLTAFQIEGQNEIPLQIEGWDEQVVYEY